MGYQNHTNRPIEWTEPGVEVVVEQIEARRVVVVAPSFMHEQSETLSELDLELRGRVEARGMAFHRVPVPFDHPRFVSVLADLVQSRTGAEPAGHAVAWRRCMCRGAPGALCTNGMRLDAAQVTAPPRERAGLSLRRPDRSRAQT
jgi:ferrochelatase